MHIPFFSNAQKKDRQRQKSTFYYFPILLLLSICTIEVVSAQEARNFSSIKEVFLFAKSKNNAFQNAVLQTKIAELARKTAIGNTFSPKIPSSIQMLNNINQQVSFLPGQAFGLPEGTFKPVTIGQQYATTFNFQPQFDILNLVNLAQIKTSKINQELVSVQNEINEHDLYDKINAVYFNILSSSAQKDILKENIKNTLQIQQIVRNKYTEGVARKQEVNEIEATLISLQDKLEQLEWNMKSQYEILNLFFENTTTATLSQKVWEFENTNPAMQTQNDLSIKNAVLQTKIAKQEAKSLAFQNIPVLSLITSFNWQNLSNEQFFATKSNWINYNYVGLKLSYDFPTTIQKYTNLKTKNIQLAVLRNNEIHAKKENETRNALLILDYQKAIQQKENFKKIYDLKKDSYQKNYNQFLENILPLDKLLISQNDLILSELNLVSTIATVGFNKTKIEINNGL